MELTGMKLKVALAAAFLTVATNVPAFARDGDELLAECLSKAGSLAEKQCESYVLGVVEGANALSTSMRLLHPESASYPKLFCAETATPEELTRATKEYLQKNPNTRHFGAASEVMLALQQSFPSSE
jgi:hypothetical protein